MPRPSCWIVVIDGVGAIEFWFLLLIFGCSCFRCSSASMKLPIGAGRVFARLYMAFVLGLFALNCFREGMGGGGVP